MTTPLDNITIFRDLKKDVEEIEQLECKNMLECGRRFIIFTGDINLATDKSSSLQKIILQKYKKEVLEK